MAGSKKFFHDRIVLLLISVNSFLVLLTALTIVLRLGSAGHVQGLIGEYRSNLGLSEFKPGDTATFIGFIVFTVAVLAFHIVMGRRVYHVRRQFALAVMGMATLLILLTTIVSNSLLGL